MSDRPSGVSSSVQSSIAIIARDRLEAEAYSIAFRQAQIADPITTLEATQVNPHRLRQENIRTVIIVGKARDAVAHMIHRLQNEQCGIRFIMVERGDPNGQTISHEHFNQLSMQTVTHEQGLQGLIQAIRQDEPSSNGTANKTESPKTSGAAYDLSMLTLREKEILKLIAEGKSSKQISIELHRAYGTIIRHRANIMEKLGVHDRVELTRLAIRAGLIEI